MIESKLSKNFISKLCMKLVALRINRYTRNSSQFQKGWLPLSYTVTVSLFPWWLEHDVSWHRQEKQKVPPKQTRNQLGAPGGAKSFLRGAQIFW